MDYFNQKRIDFVYLESHLCLLKFQAENKHLVKSDNVSFHLQNLRNATGMPI